jgi:carbon-monoxide dehydrogenase small subunit
MLMRACEIIEQNPDPSPEQVREGIASNLCRCTGYQFIIEAVCAAAGRMRGEEQRPDQATMPTEAKA